jgi:hypothetical protein
LVIKGKLILRKAVAYQRQGLLDDALKAAKHAKNLNKQNKEAHVIFKKIEVFISFQHLSSLFTERDNEKGRAKT